MKYLQNLHTHCTFCDGKDTPEEMVKRAIELGFEGLGFSSHCHMPYSPGNYLNPEKAAAYRAETARLKEKYAGQLNIWCGIEFDLFSPTDELDLYDYVIGSVHYFRFKALDRFVGFDRNADAVQKVIDEYFGGDGLAFAEAYYADCIKLPDFARCDIVGHIDLITKNLEERPYFDTEHPRYRKAAFEAVEVLAKRVGIFELNTGAISRGYRTIPYPEPFLLRAIREQGGKMIISSDCHNGQFLDCYFDESLELLKSCGFKEVYTFNGKGFDGHLL